MMKMAIIIIFFLKTMQHVYTGEPPSNKSTEQHGSRVWTACLQTRWPFIDINNTIFMINVIIVSINVIIITLLILMGNLLLQGSTSCSPTIVTCSTRTTWATGGWVDIKILSRQASHMFRQTCSDKKIFLLIKAADQVDVVFIHGLLGGVFYTWRQQDTGNSHELSDDQVREDDYQLEHNPNKKWRQYWRWWSLGEPRWLLVLLASRLAGWRQQPCKLEHHHRHHHPQHPHHQRQYLFSKYKLFILKVRVIGCDFDSYLSQWGGSCPTQSFEHQSLEERCENSVDVFFSRLFCQSLKHLFSQLFSSQKLKSR